MPDKEKAIRGLECCLRINAPNGCSECPYAAGNCDEVLRDAISLLKEQEPRVLTLEELWNVGRVWESSAPPYLWLDKNRSIYNTISFWCAWRDIYEMIHGRHDKYTDENYGSEWRVWNLQPTPEQMRDTPWEEHNG